VDWRAVASGQVALRIRQKPGPGNGMGSVKFMMPNKRGIYLHDTPDRGDFRQERRLKSAGCIRVEDAERLARWLGVSAPGRTPEQRVALASPVPIYLVYRTVALENGRLVERPDVYGLDRRAEPASRA
jgi:L,D-transpeptidase YcbB